jgi:diguanylate cyclase (GGDEF)-like protein
MPVSLEVLIIDDDEIDRMSIRRALKQVSIPVNVVEAKTGTEGIAFAQSKNFDVILLDFSLPDCNGLDVLSILRQDPSINSTVVMLSRQENPLLAEQAIEGGAQDFLLKDEVNPRRLMRAVRQAQYRQGLEGDLKRSREQLRLLAEHDGLTGLANRYDFERAIELAVLRCQRHGGHLAVLILDVDKFKLVNDTFGHAAGDELLIEVARRLKMIVRESDLLARLGGDEFVILAQDLQSDDQAILMANRIVACFAEPMVFNDVRWDVTTSIGISVFGDYTNNKVDLMRCADIAMYRAKQAGRNQSHFYSDQLHQSILERVVLERDLRSALVNKEFRVYYQAMVNAKDGTLGGLEALIRWEHPRMGLLFPISFLSLAEELGLMCEIDQWVLHTACHQLQDWRSRYVLNDLQLGVAVNLSAMQLQGEDLMESLKNTIQESGLPAACIELEITENVLISNPHKITSLLSAIADMGVRLALDDFGTGFSSFEHLKLFPVHTLKIDRSFVSGVGQGDASERLLAAMIHFARTLGLTVVAEGVEDAAQAEFCRSHGCHLLQGYYYSRPVPADKFEAAFMASTFAVCAT